MKEEDAVTIHSCLAMCGNCVRGRILHQNTNISAGWTLTETKGLPRLGRDLKDK